MSTPSISERLVPRIFNRYVAISVGSVLVVISVVRAYKKRKQLEQKRNSYPRDVVILHHLEPGFNAPSTSPYVLKLETWLRLADVKYQNEFAFEFGSKGKIPFITYNGEEVCDTDFIIQYLSKKLDKDLSKNFSLKDQGIARAFSKMNEESIMWVVALHRYVYKPDQSQTGLPWYLYKFIFTPVFKRRGKAQGYGLHSQEEVYSIGRKDLKSINDFLEGKKFLLGDRPCNEDSSLFGMICQILYHENGPMNKFVKSECPNIVSYIDRIKSTYWQDWDQRITNKSKTNA